MGSFLAKLENPPREFRPVPFWSWNYALDPEFLRWQIQEMSKAGLGGFFMHARGGLKTDYMGEEWHNCVRTGIETGRKDALGAWIYDEDGWPSGFAAGLVPAMSDKYQVRRLELEEIDDGVGLGNEAEILGIYYDQYINHPGRFSGSPISITNAKRLVIRQKANPCYADLLNPEAVRAFINTTHETYYQRFQADFGKEMPGFFTDEPQFSRESIPWSPGLPKRFRQKYGYDLIPVLPALFLDCEGCAKIRYDFWSLTSELFVNSFGRQIYEWCEAHHCKITGHLVGEESLFGQMRGSVGVMPFYEYLHLPGMDWLGRKICSPLIPKQVSSVAGQLGKEGVLAELFALCGWDLSLEEMKMDRRMAVCKWSFPNLPASGGLYFKGVPETGLSAVPLLSAILVERVPAFQ